MSSRSKPEGVSPSVVAVALIVAVIAAAAGLYLFMSSSQKEETPKVEPANPFEGLAPEAPPEK